MEFNGISMFLNYPKVYNVSIKTCKIEEVWFISLIEKQKNSALVQFTLCSAATEFSWKNAASRNIVLLVTMLVW